MPVSTGRNCISSSIKFSNYSRDLNASLRTYAGCQSSYPHHQKAPEALFQVIEMSLA